ncbi:MAG: hypothetical protein A4S09_11295 [Proteobacteria bacterium SG_bin7]|nr:MAG: hypothetical protein A4S09_11295 [Proteobacteria bacterium SG_bin7]
MKKITDERSKLSLTIENIKEAISEWEHTEKIAARISEVKADEERRMADLIKTLKAQLDSLT